MGILLSLLTLSLGAGAELNAEAMARYQRATGDITGARWSQAITALNGLAGEYPRVAEIFAARCSALVGIKNYVAAEADCDYALKVKPTLAAARYALAIAQEYQGKRDAALANYRAYAELDPSQAPYRANAAARVDALSSPTFSTPPMVTASGSGGPTQAAVGPSLVIYKNHLSNFGRLMLVLDGKLIGDLSMDEYVEVDATAGEHLLEARTYPRDGYEAPRVWVLPVQLGLGTVYTNFQHKGGQLVLTEVPAAQARSEIRSDCKKAFARTIGPDSVPAPPAAMAGDPGVVAAWPGGAVVVAPGVRSRVAGARTPAPECRMSSRGYNTCGYNCRLGSDGDFYCSSVPNGQCALNADGSWSCP
ncbi:MAG: hypothetical protein JNK82_43465 [Myxococcaceae bacterium]|nr:hypothetical protein [Myxococcaceae bacterium]